ncbi:MAG: fumarylacetoacetate hydrolase family protein [Flavobacteriales bacterium]|nr:fumarylacetoacetate hydrolase family protein [Flavobacteriales bacterium]
MKIICIGRNYADHAKELNNPLPKEPLFFLKPDSAILPNNNPFFIPEFTNEVHYELEIVLKINRIGKHIEPQFAHKYFEEIGLGIDFTARDIQQQCKEKGHPWEKAKSFDGSAPLGSFVNKNELSDLSAIHFSLTKNGETVQNGNTKDMIFSFGDIISYVSKFMTLKIGDLIFTGTPAGVGPVSTNDLLEGFIEDKKMLSCRVK